MICSVDKFSGCSSEWQELNWSGIWSREHSFETYQKEIKHLTRSKPSDFVNVWPTSILQELGIAPRQALKKKGNGLGEVQEPIEKAVLQS